MASIPVAVPVSDMDFPKTSSEEYELEQKKDALYRAEQDLVSVIASAEDFFDTPTEKEETLQRIKNNPEAILSSSEKPFMKKIARVMVAVATLTQEVEAATELVADQHLTPAQVKAHIHKVCKEQQVFLEKKMEERIFQMEERFSAEREEWKRMLSQLQQDMNEERRHRKAFQAKVKDFSEEVYMVIGLATSIHTGMFLCQPGSPYERQRLEYGPPNWIQHIKDVVGLSEVSLPEDSTGTKNFIVYKRASVPTLVTGESGPAYEKKIEKRSDSIKQFTFTTF